MIKYPLSIKSSNKIQSNLGEVINNGFSHNLLFFFYRCKNLFHFYQNKKSLLISDILMCITD